MHNVRGDVWSSADEWLIFAHCQMESGQVPNLPEFIDLTAEALEDPKLTLFLPKRIDIARRLALLTEPGSEQEKRIQAAWKKAHVDWAKDDPGFLYFIKNKLAEDTANPDSRFAKVAADARFDVVKLQFAGDIARLAQRTGGAEKLRSLQKRFKPLWDAVTRPDAA